MPALSAFLRSLKTYNSPIIAPRTTPKKIPIGGKSKNPIIIPKKDPIRPYFEAPVIFAVAIGIKLFTTTIIRVISPVKNNILSDIIFSELIRYTKSTLKKLNIGPGRAGKMLPQIESKAIISPTDNKKVSIFFTRLGYC